MSYIGCCFLVIHCHDLIEPKRIYAGLVDELFSGLPPLFSHKMKRCQPIVTLTLFSWKIFKHLPAKIQHPNNESASFPSNFSCFVEQNTREMHSRALKTFNLRVIRYLIFLTPQTTTASNRGDP